MEQEYYMFCTELITTSITCDGQKGVVLHIANGIKMTSLYKSQSQYVHALHYK